MIKKILKNLNFSEKEIEIYLAMIKIDQATATLIARESGVKRTTVYDALELLMSKGLVSKIKKSNKSYFYALPPDKLINYLERRKQEYNQKIDLQKEKIKKIMPELISMQNLKSKSRPKVQFFEGTAGIKEAYNDTIKYPNQVMLSFFPKKVISGVDDEYFIKEYVPLRVKNNIWMKALAPDTKEMKNTYPQDPKSLRTVRFMPADKLNFEIDLSLYGKNKILLAGFNEKIAIIIESKEIYTSLKSIFEIMWESLE